MKITVNDAMKLTIASLSGHFLKTTNCIVKQVVYGKIDQTLVNSLHRLLYCEIGGLDCRVITTEYRTRVHCILICNALVHVIYSGSVWSIFVYNNNLHSVCKYD